MNIHEKTQIKKYAFFEEKMAANIKINLIREAAPALFKLAQKIVEGGVYDLILSDDASGRLVSLFLKKILDGVQEKNGLKKPDIRFVAGGQHNDMQTFAAIGELVKKNVTARILLVTEYVDSGLSISKLISILELANSKFDVAILSGRESGIKVVEQQLKLVDVNSPQGSNRRVYYGELGRIGLNFYGDSGRNMSGVKKESNATFPKRNIPTHTREEHKKEMQQQINLAREDIDLLAKETLKKLF